MVSITDIESLKGIRINKGIDKDDTNGNNAAANL
jgi:hypothetical protein